MERFWDGIFAIISTPIIAAGLWIALTFAAHWISGEGGVHASGDPLLMVGAMLTIPIGIIALACGIVRAILIWFLP